MKIKMKMKMKIKLGIITTCIMMHTALMWGASGGTPGIMGVCAEHFPGEGQAQQPRPLTSRDRKNLAERDARLAGTVPWGVMVDGGLVSEGEDSEEDDDDSQRSKSNESLANFFDPGDLPKVQRILVAAAERKDRDRDTNSCPPSLDSGSLASDGDSDEDSDDLMDPLQPAKGRRGTPGYISPSGFKIPQAASSDGEPQEFTPGSPPSAASVHMPKGSLSESPRKRRKKLAQRRGRPGADSPISFRKRSQSF